MKRTLGVNLSKQHEFLTTEAKWIRSGQLQIGWLEIKDVQWH